MNRQRIEQTWPVDTPSKGFADRVVSQALSERVSERPSPSSNARQSRRLTKGLVWLAAAVLAGLVIANFRPTPPGSGEKIANQRVEVSLEGGSVVVLEPGAKVAWHGRSIQQTRGDVFYRVEHAEEPFSVTTPVGVVEVFGTCFGIRIGGQAASAAATVHVYEGEVQLSRGESRLKLRAGEVGTLNSTGAYAGEVAAASAVGNASAKPPGSPAADQVRNVERLRALLREVAAEKADLEQQIRTLVQALPSPASAAPPASEPTKEPLPEPYPGELDEEDWKELAAVGGIQFVIPCIVDQGHTWAPAAPELKALGISAEEGEVLAEAHARSNERLWKVIRPLCLDVVGNESVVDMLSGVTCQQIVWSAANKVDPKASDAAFQRVADVRAGLEPMPDPSQMAHPVFASLWAMTGEMARFESDLARSFGSEEGRRLAWESQCKHGQRYSLAPEHNARAPTAPLAE